MTSTSQSSDPLPPRQLAHQGHEVGAHGLGLLESSDFDGRLRLREKRGDRLASPIGLKARGQVLQHVAALLPAGGHHRQHPLDEPAPRLARRTPADPSPDHRMPQSALRRVVRRFHPGEPHEIPQALLHAKDLGAGPGRRRAAALHAVLQGAAHPRPQAEDPRSEATLFQRTVPRLVPGREQPVRQPEQPSAGRLPGAPRSIIARKSRRRWLQQTCLQ